ncbi:MAG: hypothetical protein WDN08_11480 [Rhizomicrobium sp.]
MPGYSNVYVAGDTVAFKQSDGGFLPGVAPAAKQAGAYIGALIAARAAGKAEPKPSPMATSALWRRSAGATPSPISAASI